MVMVLATSGHQVVLSVGCHVQLPTISRKIRAAVMKSFVRIEPVDGYQAVLKSLPLMISFLRLVFVVDRQLV